MTSIPDCLTVGVLFTQKRPTVLITIIVLVEKKQYIKGFFDDCRLAIVQKRDLIPQQSTDHCWILAQSNSDKDKEKKTTDEVRLKPAVVNPRVMAYCCDLMAMHFLWRCSRESLSHIITLMDCLSYHVISVYSLLNVLTLF